MNPCTSVRAPRMSYTSTHHDRALTCTYAQISLSCRMPTPREAPPLGVGLPHSPRDLRRLHQPAASRIVTTSSVVDDLSEFSGADHVEVAGLGARLVGDVGHL